MAIRKGKLQFIGDRFYTSSCFHAPARTKFKDLQGWDLVNLPSEVILDLPDQLNKQFGITSKFLESALNEYNIQTIGRELLEKEFNISNPIKYFVSKTRHYSWPKGVGKSADICCEMMLT